MIATFLAVLRVLCRVAVGGVLIYSGSIKIAHPYEFLNSVYQYQLFGPRLATLVAGVLPYLELTLGIALVIGLFTLGASAMAAALFLAFSLGQITALLRGIDADCGCFGTGEPVGPTSVARTAALFAASVWCFAGAARLSTSASASPTVTAPRKPLNPPQSAPATA